MDDTTRTRTIRVAGRDWMGKPMERELTVSLKRSEKEGMVLSWGFGARAFAGLAMKVFPDGTFSGTGISGYVSGDGDVVITKSSSRELPSGPLQVKLAQ